MERIELSKVFGDVFLVLERITDNAYIRANWVGVQSEETVKTGGNHILEMLQHQPCSKLLNSNTDLIGSWDLASEWVANEWTPKVRTAGLRFLAHVLAPGVYGKLTFQQLHQKIEGQLEVKMFDDEAAAVAWLLQQE